MSTIQIRLSAISFVHDKLGHKTRNPVHDEAVISVMAGIRRTIGESQVQKSPITHALLVKLLRELPDDGTGVRDKALLLLGFALARRRSEPVALNLDDVQTGADARTVKLKSASARSVSPRDTAPAVMASQRFECQEHLATHLEYRLQGR